jgi:hypothetical protein
VAVDEQGFIRTASTSRAPNAARTATRSSRLAGPCRAGNERAGVFAIGDVRAGSASGGGRGEGAAVVSQIHGFGQIACRQRLSRRLRVGLIRRGR